MAIVGYKKMGWNGAKIGAKYGLLIQFDDRVERDEFEGIVEKMQSFMDLQEERKDVTRD
jgi:hypothetical protein